MSSHFSPQGEGCKTKVLGLGRSTTDCSPTKIYPPDEDEKKTSSLGARTVPHF